MLAPRSVRDREWAAEMADMDREMAITRRLLAAGRGRGGGARMAASRRRYASSRSTVDTAKIIRHAREAKAAAANARKPRPVVLTTGIGGQFIETDAVASLSRTVADMRVVESTRLSRSPRAQRQMTAELRRSGMAAMHAICQAAR